MIKWDGNKIAAPGMYEKVPMEAYHGDLCIGPSISSGGMRTMWSQSPAHYFVGSYLNPDRVNEDKPHFAVGRAAHKLLIEGRDGFDKEYAIRPQEWSDWRTAAAKAWRGEHIERGFTILVPDDLVQIVGMSKSLAAHPMVKTGILDGLIERSFIWKDEETGVWVKARPDALPSPIDLADLKTTGSVADDDVQRSLTNYSYHVQAAVAMAGVEAVTGAKPESFTLVFVEKEAPWAVRVITIMPEDIERGRHQMRWALREFAKCVETGNWPGPDRGATDAEFLPMSQWARNRIDERLNILLPEQEAEIYERNKPNV